MTRPVVGILHPGQMGAAIAAQAVRGGADVRWVRGGRSAATVERAERAGLAAVADLGVLLDGCPAVLSICPPAVAEDIAAEVAAHGYTGVYVEANAISPARFARIGKILAGAVVVDGAIIGPPPRDDLGARLYLAGDAAGAVAPLFDDTSVDAVVLDRPAGAASALKMAFASYQKTTRTLAAVAHALAVRHHVGDALLDEARAMAGLPLAEPGYLPSVAARAWRWAPEMLEVADALSAEGMPAELARAAAAVMECWAGDRDAFDLPVETVLERLGAPQPSSSSASIDTQPCDAR